MTDRVILVTPPDDVAAKDGVRILLVDLTSPQSKIVSDSINLLEDSQTLIVYSWTNGSDTQWLLDKKQKSQIILFNAESTNDLITGYITAQPNAHYFGILKSLHHANDCAIYDVTQLVDLLERTIKQYEKK